MARGCVTSAMKPVLLLESADMTTIFAVVGERRDDPLELLLLGEDGRHYAYPLPDGLALPVELDEAWAVDRALPPWTSCWPRPAGWRRGRRRMIWTGSMSRCGHDRRRSPRHRRIRRPMPSARRLGAIPPCMPATAITIVLALLLGACVVGRWRRRRG